MAVVVGRVGGGGGVIGSIDVSEEDVSILEAARDAGVFVMFVLFVLLVWWRWWLVGLFVAEDGGGVVAVVVIGVGWGGWGGVREMVMEEEEDDRDDAMEDGGILFEMCVCVCCWRGGGK